MMTVVYLAGGFIVGLILLGILIAVAFVWAYTQKDKAE